MSEPKKLRAGAFEIQRLKDRIEELESQVRRLRGELRCIIDECHVAAEQDASTNATRAIEALARAALTEDQS